jgi:hypothetical protein
MHGFASSIFALMTCSGLCLAQAPSNDPAQAASEQASPQIAPTQPAPAPSQAQGGGLTGTISPVGRPTTGTGVTAELRLYGMHVLSSDLDQGGDASLTRAGATMGVDIPLNDRSSLGFEMGTRVDWYDFGPGALPFVSLPPFEVRDPWDTIYRYDVGVSWQNQIDDQWGYRLGAFASSSGESDAEFSDTIEYGGFVAFSYAHSRDLILGLGVGLSSQIEDDVRVLPIPFLRWQINEKWLLASDRTTNIGGIALTYAATEDFSIGGLVGFDTSNFRLGEDASIPNGVGRHSFIPVGLIASWKPTSQFGLTGVVGMAFSQEYTLDNSDGNEIAQDDAESAGVLALVATLRF